MGYNGVKVLPIAPKSKIPQDQSAIRALTVTNNYLEH